MSRNFIERMRYSVLNAERTDEALNIAAFTKKRNGNHKCKFSVDDSIFCNETTTVNTDSIRYDVCNHLYHQ